MREFGKISSSITRSKKFRKLDDDRAQLVYLLLHISESGNSIGCFHMPPDRLAIEIRKPIEHIEDAYQRLIEIGLIRYEYEEEFIQIVGFMAHTPPSSFKHLAGVEKLFRNVPKGNLKDQLANEIADALIEKADGWSDEIESKSVFLERAKMLREKHPINTPIHTPMDTPIETAKNDTPMGGGIDTPMDTLDTDKTKTETERETETKTDVDHDDGGDLTFRERIIRAAQMDAVTVSGKINGNRSDMLSAEAWISDLNLTEDEVIDIIVETMSKKSDGPPSSFKYFDGPMKAFAGQKSQPKLEPDQNTRPTGMKFKEKTDARISRLSGQSFLGKPTDAS